MTGNLFHLAQSHWLCVVQILNEIAQHKIKIYEFPDCDDEEEMKIQKRLRVSVSSMLSFHTKGPRIHML